MEVVNGVFANGAAPGVDEESAVAIAVRSKAAGSDVFGAAV